MDLDWRKRWTRGNCTHRNSCFQKNGRIHELQIRYLHHSSLNCVSFRNPNTNTIRLILTRGYKIPRDNNYTLYVNGIDIGSTVDLQVGFQDAQSFNAPLQPSSNLFAILATNSGGPAAVIATISIEYSDGSTETVLTDNSWKTFVGSVPANFQSPSTDDSSWSAASEQGLEGVGPWGVTTIPPVLDLTQSNWIWTGESVDGVAPVGARAFRKTIITSGDRYAVCATIVIDWYVYRTLTLTLILTLSTQHIIEPH